MLFRVQGRFLTPAQSDPRICSFCRFWDDICLFDNFLFPMSETCKSFPMRPGTYIGESVLWVHIQHNARQRSAQCCVNLGTIRMSASCSRSCGVKPMPCMSSLPPPTSLLCTTVKHRSVGSTLPSGFRPRISCPLSN